MKDKFGHQRGACSKCPGCREYVAPDGDGVRCARCECKPVDHEDLSPLVASSREQPDSCTCYCPSQCQYPGCCQGVDFDPNSGIEFNFCFTHSESTGMDCLLVSVPPTQFEEEAPFSVPVLQPATQVPPAAPVLPAAPHTIPSSFTANTCALPECDNLRYVDPSTGKVHECCGYTHAMEHQRRLNLQKSNSVVKGITHCLLPDCDKLVWPFHNYCSKTHAYKGKELELTPSQTQVPVGKPKDPTLCIIPDCFKPKYVEPDGKVHPYCGKSHASLGQQLGILPTVDKEEDQCDLEGCTRPKMIEGTRVHDYCCKTHADKDAPNRAARTLTKVEDVQKWLGEFKSLKIVRLEENDAAKPPSGRLFKQFHDKMLSLPKHQRKTCLAFHGTTAHNVTSICQNGYDPGLRGKQHGQAHGSGEYFATTPDTSMTYCCSGKKMLLNELLLGQQGVHHTRSGNIIVMKDPAHDLPRFIITFQ